MALNHRGVDSKEEIHAKRATRDHRGVVAKIRDGLKVKTNLCALVAAMAAACYVVPVSSTPLVVVAALLTWFGMRQIDECPLKMPIHAEALDPNELHPATLKPTIGMGIFYLGNDRDSGKQVWLTNSDCRQHFLILGTTGSGKTELLVGFCANALAWASGFLMVDGKGDIAVFAKIYALARRFGRTDDLLVLNFMTEDKMVGGEDGTILSNTLNPFSTGGADVLTQMVVSLMDDAGGGGDMWKGRATAMFTGVMRALVFLRDSGFLDLNVGEIRDHLNLRRIIDMADKDKYPEMPESIRKTVTSYLGSLPGFQPEKGYKQAQTTLDQHGFLEMQFTRIMGSLADVYGHIFATPYGEVDMFDVVLNRRILMVMLPALGKAKDEVANLGKIIVASLKRMMGATLGSKLEGPWLTVVDQRMTNSPSPFIVILDEVGYYCVEGMDLMAAQARSLGFSMTYAAQDINGMKSLNDKIVGSIIGNTNTKIIMRIEDEETSKLAISLAGQAYKPMALNMAAAPNEVSTVYRTSEEARAEQIDRINFRDMKGQKEGQMHIIHADWVVRATGLYANPVASLNKKYLKLRANHFLKVQKPKPEDLEAQVSPEVILELLLDPNFADEMTADAAKAAQDLADDPDPTDQIGRVARTYAQVRASRPTNPQAEGMCAALAQVAELARRQGDALARRVAPAPLAYAGGADVMDRARPPAGRPMTPPGHLGDLPPGLRADPLRRDPRDPYGEPPRDLGFDDFMDRDMPPRRDAGFDPMDDDLPPLPRRDRPARTLQGLVDVPRRPVQVRDDVDHEFDVGGRPMANEPGEDDAVFRMLADLDFPPESTTAEQVEARLSQATGAAAPGRAEDAAPPAAIDAVAYEADLAMPPPPSIDDEDDATPPPPADAKGGGDYVSDFLSGLIDEDERDGR